MKILNRLINTLITCALLTTGFNSHAQDVHFSQFFASPISLNPALSGSHNYDLRIVDNYRNQWFTLGIPYVSNAVSADFPDWKPIAFDEGYLLFLYEMPPQKGGMAAYFAERDKDVDLPYLEIK